MHKKNYSIIMSILCMYIHLYSADKSFNASYNSADQPLHSLYFCVKDMNRSNYHSIINSVSKLCIEDGIKDQNGEALREVISTIDSVQVMAAVLNDISKNRTNKWFTIMIPHLVQAQTDINWQDEHGFTLLHYIFDKASPNKLNFYRKKILELLMNSGYANPYIKDNLGLSAYDKAKLRDEHEQAFATSVPGCKYQYDYHRTRGYDYFNPTISFVAIIRHYDKGEAWYQQQSQKIQAGQRTHTTEEI